MRIDERQKLYGYINGAKVMAKAKIKSLQAPILNGLLDDRAHRELIHYELADRLTELEADIVRNLDDAIGFLYERPL